MFVKFLKGGPKVESPLVRIRWRRHKNYIRKKEIYLKWTDLCITEYNFSKMGDDYSDTLTSTYLYNYLRLYSMSIKAIILVWKDFLYTDENFPIGLLVQSFFHQTLYIID